ncbi:Serine/threonine-protein kinase SMG1 [Schistosoma japonicum]|uniref:Serine/threonine-protein kinase SMG1 n=2 Tax=Schistosoma japonicum TaxID=6182 RepID=A0A4Z2D9L9_SCHJA|nr:Serine/threonine-protein kinase SMG1 [Schistosoma japonicum]
MGKCGTTIQNWLSAIEKGDLSLVQKLWKDISDIDVTDTYLLNNTKHENVTGLIVGAYYGHKDIVRWLLKNKANVNWETNLKWRPIHFAAKRGHCATVDMLCSSGAVVDPVTLSNETPLLLAVQSHMRDTVRKLVHLGAKTNKSNESLVYHYVYPGMLLPDNLTPASRDLIDLFHNKNSNLHQNARTISTMLPVVSTACSNNEPQDFSVAVFDSHIIMNQLQCQSTSYDLELARRKRELIRRLPLLPCISLQSANQFLQLSQRVSRADLPLENRLFAVSQLFDLLPVSFVIDTHSEISNKTTSVNTLNEPYLRLIEACLCETHCPLELTVQLSRLAVHIASLGVNKQIDVSESASGDDFSPKSNTPSAHVISYILKLFKKLVLKGNPQYRSGIIAHLSRILSELYAPKSVGKGYNISSLCSWTDLMPFSSSIVSHLIRLGESLDQPLNVHRFAQLVGLIARCLIGVYKKASSSSFSSRFSDLADILVGWSVDSSGTSKDVNVDIIYEELYYSLSHWFLVTAEEKTDEFKEVSLSPTINENIREMITHLLEDSEISLNAAVSEYANTNCRRGTTISGSVKQGSDPNSHFVSVQLFLNVLCSTFGGICKHILSSTHPCFHNVMSANVSQWIERLLRIIQSTSAYYTSFISQKQNGLWHSSHGNVSTPRVQLLFLDGIQASVFKLLSCLIQFCDCSDADIIAVDSCVISSVGSGSLLFTTCSLSSLLELVFTILKRKYSSTFVPTNPSSLLIYFDSHSKLHQLKFCCKSSYREGSPPSQNIFRVLSYMSSIMSLQNAVCELALCDLRLAVGSQKHFDPSASRNRKSEILGLFSLSLITEMMKNMTCEHKNELLYRVYEVIQPNCLENWHHFPPRLRIVLLSLMNNPSFLKLSQPIFILNLFTSFLSVNNISSVDCHVLLNLTNLFLSEGILDPDDQLSLMFHLVTLSKRMLLTQITLDSNKENVFILVVDLLIKHALPHIEKENANLSSSLLHLSQISLSYPCSKVQKAGNDLLLLVGSLISSKVEFPATFLYSELLWFTTRRPDQSATSLLPVSNMNDCDASHNLITITTAFPSLPAVAGILGILTRGAPYTRKIESSRLKILERPNDWIRRLSCLISPLPSDKKCNLSLLQCTSFIQPVLWHTAWAMVDYKLKVAPWANPLKTFFSLEGTLRGIIQPIFSSDSSNSNQSSIISFHIASSEALSHQKESRYLSQIHLLLNFLNYLERVIFNATKGFAIALPRSSTSASIFFAANENTCSQWFNRIRSLLVRISSDLPLVSCFGLGPANEVLSTTVYHAYSLLEIVSNYNSPSDKETWLDILKQYCVPTDLFIHLSKALHHLGAWEELEALAQWMDDLFTAGQNPLLWLHGISYLTRGHVDRGILQLNSFLDSNLPGSKVSVAENFTANETDDFSVQTSLAYVANVLLQMYLSEGNYTCAHKLRNRITSCVKSKSLKQNLAFQLNSARLDCLSKLSEWVSTDVTSDNRTSDSSQLWSYNCLQKKLNYMLANAVYAQRDGCIDTENETLIKFFSEFTTIIRQESASTTFLLPLNFFADYYSQTNFILDDGLQDYMIKAQLLINEQTRTKYGTASPINYSSWIHLISSNIKVHTAAEFSACEWACLNNCPHLAQRLLVKAAKYFTILDTAVHSEAICFDRLCKVALSSPEDITSKLSQINTLMFYNCMAKILWLFGEGNDEHELTDRTKAISILTSGLKLVLSETNSCDKTKSTAQCDLEAEMTLNLFDWLESPVNSNDISMAERIYRCFTSSDEPGQKSQKLLRIASDLELFNYLSDVTWCNGMPNITKPFQSTTSYPGSSTSWTNRLLMMATHLSSSGSSASVWLKLANWCYLRGHKEIHEFQSAAKNFIKTLEDKSSNHLSVPVLLKLVQPQEYNSLVLLADELFPSFLEKSDDNKDGNLSVTTLISALTTFLANDRYDEDDSELFKHHSTLPVHLHQFSFQCPDDQFDFQMQQKFLSHLRNIIPSLRNYSLSNDSIQLLHQLLVSNTERQHTLHMSAAQAYATFLTIVDQSNGTENSLFYKPVSKLDVTTTTLKFLDLLCSPSRKLRSMISGFLDQASPVLSKFDHQCISVQSDKVQLSNGSKSGPTLGGPAIWEACLPQVLIRLGLPDDMIRNCLVALLNRLIYIGINNTVNSKWNSPSSRLAAQLAFPAVVVASNPIDPDKIILGVESKGIGADSPGNLNVTNSTITAILNSNSKLTPSHSFSKIVSALQNAGFSDLVRQVEIFTYELQRITVLWEELWLGSLVQHLDELSKKITILESELKRTENIDVCQNSDSSKALSKHVSSKRVIIEKENKALSSYDVSTNSTDITPIENINDHLECKQLSESMVLAKYISVLQPTFDLLSQLYSLTILVEPETPHEEWFQKTFGNTIDELRESLLHPVDPRDVKEPVSLIRHFIHQLQTTHQSTSFSQIPVVSRVGAAPDFDFRKHQNNLFYLNLRQLSPRLCSMHFENDHSVSHSGPLTCGIPLPGHFGMEASHLGSRITVLPTKTRPKRLLLRAQNGRTYPYLLKGLEDLRLDDRIMRLFELTNLAVVELSSDSSKHFGNTFARTYSVTPLGVRSGLLQMVQGAIPLFSLYKKWQLRNSRLSPNNASISMSVIPRPGELFHARLKELLHASGHHYQSHSRSSWPLEILREVLVSLEAETPADLLTRELWASNPSCASWWRVTRTFAKSAGLLSSLGYLVGLGDRHLDNLLIDLSTGHIVHIDYNVCFDKGKSLRVAERVPFRLTRILRHALGPTAQDTLVRGTFRFSAESGLQAARSIVDPLLIQLKAFLIDPLADWQQKRHPTSNTCVVTDFIHLAAFHGGGSTNSCNYQNISTYRRLRRVNSELRMYSGLLTLRLVDLIQSTCLESVFSSLDAVVSRLAVWTELTEARQHASFINNRFLTLSTVTKDVLSSSEYRCQQVEQATQTIEDLYEELSKQNEIWLDEIVSHFENYKSLVDPTWLSSVSASGKDGSSSLSIALANYYAVARIYLTNSEFINSLVQWVTQLRSFHSQMNLSIKSNNIGSLLTLVSSHIPLHPCHFDLKLSNMLEQAAKKSFNHLCELRQIKEENSPDYANPDSAVLHEINNLKLFVFDQGAAGVTAYCWALLDYVLSVSGNCLAIEIEFKEWNASSDNYETNGNHFRSLPLDQLETCSDCLLNLFSVLRHQSTGVWNFNAGYEADVRRELAFLIAVRDSVSCISQLRANLLRLLVPEAIESLITASTSMVENFSRFVLHHMTVSNTNNLRQLVDTFLLKDFIVENQRDTQLHHVLVAVHLALTNATAQLEEIATRIGSCSITALAWYYVDIISQITTVLMSKSSNWSEGAASLWRWEPTVSNNIPDNIASYSWSDEVYNGGMMAFISVLEDGLIHWRTIHHGSTDNFVDLTPKPFIDPVNCFIGRLSSRLGLASLVGLASSRLFCVLVENAGLSIHRLLVESELSAKAAGMGNVVSLSAEKIVENVSVQITLTQPVSVQHLRTPASNLITRLVSRSSQISRCAVETFELEAAEWHYKHLILSLSAYNWMHAVQVDEESQLFQQDPNIYLTSILSSIKDVAELGSVSSVNLSKISSNTIAQSIYYIETLRSSGLSTCSSFSRCVNVVNELEKAIKYKEMLISEFNELDWIVYSVKDTYALRWPIHDWFHSSSDNVLGLIKNDLTSAEFTVNKLHQRLSFIKDEFNEMYLKSESLHDDDFHRSSSSPVIISKRVNRNPQLSRSSALSTLQLTVSQSLCSSDLPSNSKPPTMIASLRSQLSALQKEKMSDIRQIVKILNRYDTVRFNLLHSDQISVNEACSTSIWNTWLDNHQNWTATVVSVLKRLTKFTSSFSPSVKLCISSESCEPYEILDETEFATSLNHDCLLVKYKLVEELIKPLLNGICENVSSNQHLLHSLKDFLTILNEHNRNMKETLFSQMKDSGVETDPKATQKIEQVTLSGRSLNVSALSVWNRVYDRLHGFDTFLPTSNKDQLMSITDQIDACIREAVNVDNLALMYEGWTAWV